MSNAMKGVDPVSEVSTVRLYLLRGMYAFMFVGLAIVKWPAIFNPPPGLSNTGSVVGSVLLAISLLAVLGIRYPLKMLPLLFFEFLWKAIWVLQWGLPPLLAQQLSPEAQETLTSCLLGVVLVPLVMPWRYGFKQYVKAPGDPWGRRVGASSRTQPSFGHPQS
jgi:hypothetical protein